MGNRTLNNILVLNCANKFVAIMNSEKGYETVVITLTKITSLLLLYKEKKLSFGFYAMKDIGT